MSKIPYISEKNAIKAKKKFMKELSKDKEAERIYQKEWNLEMEIHTSFDAFEPENEEDIELDEMQKRDDNEIDFFEKEKADAFEENEAAEDAEAMETDELGDFEE